MKIYFIWCTYPTHAVFHGDPVGLMSLSGIAKSLGHQINISIYYDSEHNLSVIKNKIAKNRYDIIGVSSNSAEKPLAIKLSNELKNNSAVKICGGLGPTLEPEEFQKHFDYIFIGEGEKALAEFLKQLKNKRKIDIRGVYSKTDKGPFLPTELTENLDSLPFPDYGFKFGLDEVPKGFLRTDMGIYMGARGCPSACNFCFNSTFLRIFKGEYFRFKSAEKVCEELELMKRMNPTIKSWNVLEDTFMVRPIEEIEKITSKWHSLNTPFDIATRVIDIKKEKIEIAVRNGLRSLNVGIERATPELRNFCNKPYFDNETLFEALKILKDCKVPQVTLSNMGGFPDETRETLARLLRLNIRAGNLFSYSATKFISVFFPLRLFPGSPWYDKYRQDIRENFNHYKNHFLPNLKVKGLSDEELESWARFFVPYSKFLVDLKDEKQQEAILVDIENKGPQLTAERMKLLKRAVEKRGGKISFWGQKIKNPHLFSLNPVEKFASKVYDKFFNN